MKCKEHLPYYIIHAHDVLWTISCAEYNRSSRLHPNPFSSFAKKSVILAHRGSLMYHWKIMCKSMSIKNYITLYWLQYITITYQVIILSLIRNPHVVSTGCLVGYASTTTLRKYESPPKKRSASKFKASLPQRLHHQRDLGIGSRQVDNWGRSDWWIKKSSLAPRQPSLTQRPLPLISCLPRTNSCLW